MMTARRASWQWAIASLIWIAVAQAGEDDVARILAQYDAMGDKVKVSVSATKARLMNSRADYVLTALDREPSARKPSTLGMNEPINANFYYGGFVSIRAGRTYTGIVKPKLSQGTDHTGAACAIAVWELEGDTFTMSFTLLLNSNALMVELTSKTGAAAKTPFFVRFGVYPQSFNRAKHGKPRANFLVSSTGKRLNASTSQSFGTAEKWVYLGDAKYAGREGGAAVGIDPATVKDLKVHLGGYSVSVDLFFKPGKIVRCYLVDFGKREIKNVPKEVPALMNAEAARFEAWMIRGRLTH